MLESSPGKFQIYDFTDSRDNSVVEEWKHGQDKGMIARLDQKLDMLHKHGSDLAPGLLAGTKYKHIDKLRVFGPKVTWRFLICKGPLNNDTEFTILFIAQEKDRKLIPKDAEKRADDNRNELIANHARRKKNKRYDRNTADGLQ